MIVRVLPAPAGATIRIVRAGDLTTASWCGSAVTAKDAERLAGADGGCLDAASQCCQGLVADLEIRAKIEVGQDAVYCHGIMPRPSHRQNHSSSMPSALAITALNLSCILGVKDLSAANAAKPS